MSTRATRATNRSRLQTVCICLFYILVNLRYLVLIVLCICLMFFILLILAKICCLLISLHLIIIALLNFTHLISVLRTAQRGKLCCKVEHAMAYTQFLHLTCIKLFHKLTFRKLITSPHPRNCGIAGLDILHPLSFKQSSNKIN